MLGTRVSHYRVLDCIGSGGMGVVYLAEDERLSRRVALKFIAPSVAADADARARLLREARTASSLDHPNIATVYEAGDWNDQLFLALAYYPGETLKDRIARGVLPLEEALSIGEQIARGLAAAHSATIVHRDLKPANVMITTSGIVKILDFGLAKGSGPLAETALDITGAGVMTGTISYMAPEQARGAYVDTRADIWALGIVLFEMLAGRVPFRGATPMATLTALLTEGTPLLRPLRPDVPPEIERLIQAALIKDPERRTLAASAIASALAATRERLRLRNAPHPGRRVVVAAAVVGLLTIAALTPWMMRTYHARRAATVLLPEARQLAGTRNAAAFDLATEAERYISGSRELTALWPTIARTITIESEPAGAEVSYKEYGISEDWRSAGHTPLQGIRLPLGWLQVRVTKNGFDPGEDVVGNHLGQGSVSSARFVLAPAGTSPAGMVRAAQTMSPFSVYVLGLELPRVTLTPFWIDRQEVSNRDFKRFVDAGGYHRREFWQPAFTDGTRVLTWEQAQALFRDATGQPGPAGWELGTFPEGQGDLPVSGVSWYEAAAYAAFAGKQLPTIYHWSWVAAQPLVGYVIPFARFNSKTPIRADSPAAVHRFGAVNLAGNVKEWTFNESGGGRRYILGGGFDEPPYMFEDADARSPFDRATNFGFRCIKLDPGDASFAALSAPVPGPSRDYSKESPVNDELFAAYARLYSYDRTDLEPTIEGTSESAEWRIERVTFAAAYPNERVIAYVFLPKVARPPYQAVVFVPAANAWDTRSSAAVISTPPFAFLLRGGRAVVLPIYKGTYERGSDDFKSDYRKSTNRWRDHVIAVSRDLSRTVDYLQTRRDIDMQRLGYFGTSRGAALAPMMLAVEERFHAAALWLPGLYLESLAPEVDGINFLPRVKTPSLVLSGRYDYNFRDEASSQPFFNMLGTPADQKRRVVYDTGHNLPANEAVKETLNWFDRFLGPVR
jgi:eukaryotic-like serine/threonine-protein kinase